MRSGNRNPDGTTQKIVGSTAYSNSNPDYSQTQFCTEVFVTAGTHTITLELAGISSTASSVSTIVGGQTINARELEVIY